MPFRPVTARQGDLDEQLAHRTRILVEEWDKVVGSERAGDRAVNWGFSPIYVTADGARITFAGRHINSDGSGWFQLMATHQENLLRYHEYETPAMDALGRRFAYWPNTQPLQVATMELNVPWDRLRGVPKVSEVTIDPPAIPRLKAGVAGTKLAARASGDPTPAALSGTGFRNGLYDDSLAQGNGNGSTNLNDDGKTDASGDATAGDGVFTGRWVGALPNAPADPQRTIRVEAQIAGAEKLAHGYIVEVGPFPVVDQPPPAGPVTIDGTPPAQPMVTPNPPGTDLAGPMTPPAGPTGPTGPTPPTGAKDPPTAGVIDLTGYWVAESGALHFVRQIGKSVYWSVDALPKVRNIFTGTIDGDVLTGVWVDLPGGTIETGTGTLKLKIESNDKLTKISDSTPYAAAVWTRTTKPPGGARGPGSGASSGASSGTGASAGTEATAASGTFCRPRKFGRGRDRPRNRDSTGTGRRGAAAVGIARGPGTN